MRLPAIVRTLKFRIVAIAAATGVFAALGTAQLIVQVTQADLQRLLLTNARDDRERTAELLAGKLETIKQALRAVAGQATPDVWRDRAAMEQFLLGQPALSSLFDGVLAARRDGSMLARLDRGVPSDRLPNIADRDYFQGAMKTDQVVVSAPLMGRVSKVPLVILAVAVAAPDGTVRGAVAGTLRLQSNGLFAAGAAKREGDGSTDLVIDRAGAILSHPRAERLLGRAADEPGLADVFAQWHASGSPIDTDGSATLSQGHMVSMAGIPMSDWVHVRLTPESVAMQPVSVARRSAWSAAAGAGLLAALLSGAWAWLLLRPISELRSRAERMLTEDGPSTEGWPGGGGELGDMARAFQQLLAQRQQRQVQLRALLAQFEAVLDNAEVGIALSRRGGFEW